MTLLQFNRHYYNSTDLLQFNKPYHIGYSIGPITIQNDLITITPTLLQFY